MRIFPVYCDNQIDRYRTCRPEKATGFVIELKASDFSPRVGHRFHFDEQNSQTYWCGDQIAYLSRKYCSPGHEIDEEWLIGKLKEMPIWEKHLKELGIPASPRWNVKSELPKLAPQA